MKSRLEKLREKSPLAKYQSVKANLIEGGIPARKLVSFLWILVSIFWIKISKSLFVILRNSWIPNHFLHWTHEEGCFRTGHCRVTRAGSKNISHILAVYFFSLQICKYIPRTYVTCSFTTRTRCCTL